MVNMKETEYYKSGRQSENLAKARKKALKKCPCRYCRELRTKGNLPLHEQSCYLNPKNIRLCPVCQDPIKNYKSHNKNKPDNVTCSYKCSNKYFRTGPSNGNWKDERYQSTCFHFHKKECVVCGENNIVEVHHLDENHNNNSPSNLIPLCPTHHRYWHSRYKHLIEDKVKTYILNWSEAAESNCATILPKDSDDPASSPLI
jgi:hypothetical protein